jgi:hypothetical protein
MIVAILVFVKEAPNSSSIPQALQVLFGQDDFCRPTGLRQIPSTIVSETFKTPQLETWSIQRVVNFAAKDDRNATLTNH